ncbi:MAG: replication factor C small subunit [Nitrosopumilaceae archaeon]|jgi:replication factor C small subunit|uniref:Replication factor C small subunit n=2 Tax=Candidatus Nitrosomaritimum aestuariumsis TaxID=3342354 RepID=A0AC60W064_9ARCH|nr:replication factor C small subunit [Nitrosopumilaceae archaeon]MBA4460384.1 replication factor C small subunit [Nitrosopumilaceae archaeon]MBA4461178.1 replication factor C small subunit [Nitrosopumilaceae archaeon]MBA4463868.1 replication factor C small subunit [Nitrosopumilaceae archaeon]NCF22312.1 replication factor C small subunit [Nitrosopumilaceae archaeon]
MPATGMWVEKYRPQKLSDIVNQTEIIGSLESLIKDPTDMPHLLFSGSAGVGKTTAAMCISNQILGEYAKEYTLELNASDERGIGMVREKVKKFSRFAGMADAPFKLIILDEADEMTNDAQTALRRIIEDTAQYCRFILIANNISKIIEPIQSRCAAFKFTTIPEEDVINRLAEIAKKEKLKADKKGLQAICEYSEGDMRHAINLLQATASIGDVTEEHVKASAGLTKTTDVDVVLKMALSGKITDAREKMIELIKVYGMSESDFLKYLNSAVFKSKHAKLSQILESIAKYDYRILVGANPEIQLSALLAELGSLEE